MPIHFTIDRDECLVRYRVEGVTTPAEAEEFITAVVSDPLFRRGFGFIGDWRAAAPTADYIQAIAAILCTRAPLLAPCRWAIVVPSEAMFGLVTMWKVMTGKTGISIEPFLSPDRARDWVTGKTGG